jgi:hypothetical protein
MPSAARTNKKKVAVAAAAAAEETSIVETVVPAPKKKASKKPVKVVAIVTADGIDGSFSPEPRRPLIAHLQIRTNEVLFHDQALRYDPNPPSEVDPTPYDAANDDVFTAGQEELRPPAVVTVTAAVVASEPVVVAAAPTKPMPCFTRANLMVQYRECSEKRRIPEKTDIACFWCSHTFDTPPCIIPEREVDMVYNVYGNFCSPECGVAYLLIEGVDPHVRWERMALLHRVYNSMETGRIFPAPPRESLTLFGGPMTIEAYRSTIREKKVRVDLHMPPMVSILGSIDTKPIDFFDTNQKQQGGLPTIQQRSVEEGLRLKRAKPLKDKESTLDTVMNIKIGGGRRAT